MNEKKLEDIKIKALEEHIPIIMDDTLEVISKLIEEKKPNSLLEIGTAVGYSSLAFSKSMQKGSFIDSIEIDEEKANIARQNIKEVEPDISISVYTGSAIDIIPTLDRMYDIVFIDAAKSKYSAFLELSLKKLNKDGYILADNVLYKGYVLGEYTKHKQRTAVNHLREFIKSITSNDIFDTEILEVGDGLSITRLK